MSRLVLRAPPGVPVAPELILEDADARAGEQPGPGQVAVAVEYSGLNRIDQLLAAGAVPRPDGEHVLGGQGAGRVVAVGDGVEGLASGDLVALFPYGGCDGCDACASGNETLCRDARLDGVNAPGTSRSRMLVDARDAYPVPAGCEASDAVLAPALAVAWHVLVCRGALRAGETVGIVPMTSGLGACCGALATHLGATVIGFARQASLERLKAVPEWASEVLAIDQPPPSGRRVWVDLAVDAVGAPTVPALHRYLRTGGRIVSVGAHAGRDLELDLWRLFTREQDLRGSHGCHRSDMAEVVATLPALDAGAMIDSVYAAADHAAAYRRLDTAGRMGNVLLRFSGEAQ